MDEFQDAIIRQKYKTLHYGAFIMRILKQCGVQIPDSECSTISVLGSKTLELMQSPKQLPSHDIISFQQWFENRNRGIRQPSYTNIASSSSSQPHQQEEEDYDDI